MRSASPSTPGKVTLAVLGTRGARAPLTTAPKRADELGLEAVAQGLQLPGVRLEVGQRVVERLGGGLRKSHRRRASPAPVLRRPGVTSGHVDASPVVQQPRPAGPPSLCAESDRRSTGTASRPTAILPTACTASVWNKTPRSRQAEAIAGDRLDDAGLVVGPHHRARGGRHRPRACSTRSTSRAPLWAGGSLTIPAPSVASRSSAPSTQGCSMALVTMRRRAPSPSTAVAQASEPEAVKRTSRGRAAEDARHP